MVGHGNDDPSTIPALAPTDVVVAADDDDAAVAAEDNEDGKMIYEDVKDKEEKDEVVDTICSSWQSKAYQHKFIYTIFVILSLFVLGVCIGQKGPTFLDLQIITNSDIEKGSAFFTTSSVGYLLGSFMIGVIYERFNKILILFSSTLALGLLTGVLPFCSVYGLMVAVHLAAGMSIGGLSTCANAELIRLWGATGRSIMQTAHFSFAVGAVISPLISKPFLAPVLPSDDVNTSTSTLDTTVLNFLDNSTASTGYNGLSNTTVLPTEQRETMVFYAYLITASITVIVSIPILLVYFWERSHMKKRTADEVSQEQNRLPLPVFVVTLSLICLMYMLYCCVEDSFAAFLMTFAVKGQHWSKIKGTELTSVFWASFATGRFLGIFFTRWISSVKLLFLCSVGMILALVGFLVSAMYHTQEGIWAFTIGIGLALAVFFPTGLLWTEEKLVKVTGKVSSAILIAASIGTMVNPMMLGYLMSERDPMWFTYILTGESIGCMLVFLLLWMMSCTILKNTPGRNIAITMTVNSKDSQLDQAFI